MAKRINQKNLKKLDRYFMVAKGFLLATPFLAYLYLSLMAGKEGLTLMDLLTTNPNMTIVLLISMINPYIAYLLQLSQAKLQQNNCRFVVINFVLLIIAQALTMNTFYLVMLAYLFYVVIKTYDLNVKTALKENNLKTLFSFGGGSMLVMAVSAICLFATIKLM